MKIYVVLRYLPRESHQICSTTAELGVIESDGGRAATEASNMRWLNTVLGNVKRALDGTYHAFKFSAYIHRYLAEAQWRFNRRFDLKILVPRLLVAVARSKPWPEWRLRNALPKLAA